MEYQVRIADFEGPLDLLLYLIKETKISIDKVNVAVITQQYLDFIHEMEVLNLEVASEYLVMAAHLILIKSKMMLPKANLDDEELTFEENPEEKLKMRLKIYKLFKDIIPSFQEMEEDRSHYLTKIPTDLTNDLKQEVKEVLEKNVTTADLLSAFNRVLRRYLLHKPIKTKIAPSQITIEERILEVRKYILEKKNVFFSELYSSDSSREYIVLTFMSILELAKEKLIYISQDELYDEINIHLREVNIDE